MLDIDIFIGKIKKKSRLMGIDPGGKRIGIAISDENKIVATPYTTIIRVKYGDFLFQIKEIIDEHKIDGIVIGNPINMDGSEGPSSQSAKDLALSWRRAHQDNAKDTPQICTIFKSDSIYYGLGIILDKP